MKLSDAAKYLPFVQAAAEGKMLECYGNTYGWQKLLVAIDDFPPECLRIKPSPKLRPWRADEVPVGAWVRCKGATGFFTTIIGVCYDEVMLAEHDLEDAFKSFQMLFDADEHSLDHGKTWLPCGIEEPS